jgi:hypothetical protein
MEIAEARVYVRRPPTPASKKAKCKIFQNSRFLNL